MSIASLSKMAALYAGERETMVDVTGGRLAKLGHPKRDDALDDLAEFVITQPSFELRLAKAGPRRDIAENHHSTSQENSLATRELSR
jgi:hypothetical protein